MFRRLAVCSTLILAFAIGGAGHAQPTSGPPAAEAGNPMTMAFITKASQTDDFERREGRLALARSHNPAVRAFAQWMVTAHTKTTMALKAAIQRAGMPPPPPPALTSDQMSMMADLRAAHGAAFDKLYIDQQVQAHQMARGVVQNYAHDGPPGPIRDVAIKTVPIIQSHLDRATRLQSQGI
jgi:putative membrane protein